MGVQLIHLGAIVALLGGRALAAEPPPWAADRLVSQVGLEAPEGGLPDESLEPLLRVGQGRPLDLGEVRQDIAILYRVGSFSSVEAVVEPWFDVGADGEPIDAVRVSYRVIPAPRVGEIKVEGVRGPAALLAAGAHGLNRGEPFYPDEQGAALEARVTEALHAGGWPDAEVRLVHGRDELGNLSVQIRVEPGAEHIYGEIGVAGDEVVNPKLLRWWLLRAGVGRGRRVTDASLVAGRQAVRDHLHDKGYLNAVVNLLRVPGDETGALEDLRIIIDAGQRLELDAHGRGLPRGDELRKVLGMVPGARPSREDLRDVGERLAAWYRGRGYFEAAVSVSRELTDDVVYLHVEVRRGRRHVLGHVEFVGATTWTSRYLEGALREAAPETLGKGIVTRESVSAALVTLREFYRSKGFLDARLELADLRVGSARMRGVPLDLVVNVVEGPRTTLTALRAEGGIGGDLDGASAAAALAGQGSEASAAQDAPEAALLAAAAEAGVGQPYNPSTLDALALQISEAYLNLGYLAADVRPETALTRGEDGSVSAVGVLHITPGEQIRLRSVLIQGNHRTARRVVSRELTTRLGEPLTPAQIEESRQALYDLDLFKSVSLKPIGDDDRSRDLVVALEEKRNILAEAGVGASTDEGVEARLRLAHRNMGGLGQRVSALGQVGLGWVGDSWTPEYAAPVWRAALRYEAPYVPASGYRLIAEILLNEAVQAPYWRLSRSGASLGIQARWGAHVEAFLDYHYQIRKLQDADPGVLVQGEPWWPAASGDQAPVTPTAWRAQGGTGFTILYDGRDSRFNPTKGTLLTGAVELGDPLSADPAFVLATGLAEQRVPLGPVGLHLSARAGVGVVAGEMGTLAVEDRFTLGGSGSLRGFKTDAVGPANLSARPDVDYPSGLGPAVSGTALLDTPSHWVPTGGDTLAVLSAELLVPLATLGFGSDSTSIVLFGDFGHVGFLDSAIRTTSITRGETDPAAEPWLRIGTGLGLHVATPIGPLALDLGVNFDPIDGRGEPTFVPHLSLGSL